MKITFHAIVPMACWEWDEKSHIHIRFGHKQLGNWEVDCGQFQISRLLLKLIVFAYINCPCCADLGTLIHYIMR